jgi:hypothetical protein
VSVSARRDVLRLAFRVSRTEGRKAAGMRRRLLLLSENCRLGLCNGVQRSQKAEIDLAKRETRNAKRETPNAKRETLTAYPSVRRGDWVAQWLLRLLRVLFRDGRRA